MIVQDCEKEREFLLIVSILSKEIFRAVCSIADTPAKSTKLHANNPLGTPCVAFGSRRVWNLSFPNTLTAARSIQFVPLD